MGDADRPTDLAGFWNREVASANAAADRRERCLDLHGYGCDRAECGRGPVREGDIRGITEYLGPATSADLLELDAVPDPVDSDAPRAAFSADEPTQRNRRTERP